MFKTSRNLKKARKKAPFRIDAHVADLNSRIFCHKMHGQTLNDNQRFDFFVLQAFFVRQQLTLVLMIINVSLAFMFFKLLT